MPDSQQSSQPVRRLLVPANAPPPPIPPRLLTRLQQQDPQRKPAQPTPPTPQWIDRAEFGTAAHHWHPGAAPSYPAQPMPYGPPIPGQPPASYTDSRRPPHLSMYPPKHTS